MIEQNGASARELGEIGVSNEVFEAISVTCINKIAGVAGLEIPDGLVDSLSKVWGRSDAPKGVKVTTSENDVTLDLTVIMEEGYSIPQVTSVIQQEVKSIIEDMTGHSVKAVNILIADMQPGDPEAQLSSLPSEEVE